MKYIKKAIPLCLLALVLVLAVTLLTPKAQAATVASGACGENLTWTLDDAGTLTISGTGPMADDLPWQSSAAIKSVVFESGVTVIADAAFVGCSELQTITLPETVTYIGHQAFLWCGNLQSVVIPHSVTFIGEQALVGCCELQGIFVDASNPNYSSDENGILFDKSKTTVLQAPGALSEYKIPETVTQIKGYAFAECYYIQEIHIPQNVAFIEDSAFLNCGDLKDVYYTGSEEQWNSITIGDSNEPLLSAALHFGKEDVPEDVFVTGDMTGDGQVTNDDVVLLLWHTLFPEEYDIPYSCDLTGDGQITNADVVLLLWHTLFPEEYPLDQPSEITGVWTALQVVGNRLYEIELDLVRNTLMCGYGDDIDTLDQSFREDLLKEYESGVQCLHLVNGTYYYVGMGDGGSITYTTEGNTIYVNCDNYLYLTIVKNTDDTMTIVKSDLMGEPSGILLTRCDY